jgi:hypothetical protein
MYVDGELMDALATAHCAGVMQSLRRRRRVRGGVQLTFRGVEACVCVRIRTAFQDLYGWLACVWALV